MRLLLPTPTSPRTAVKPCRYYTQYLILKSAASIASVKNSATGFGEMEKGVNFRFITRAYNISGEVFSIDICPSK